ncbi:MAG: DoxX family protein [candidate division KSB1 bacterium]|nr:DoxX family protein [candidate division KSB1 bacterium]
MHRKKKTTLSGESLTRVHKIGLTLIRMTIGLWLFLLGLSHLTGGGQDIQAMLLDMEIMSFLRTAAAWPWLCALLTVFFSWGFLFAGLLLMLGLFSRIAALTALLFSLLFYLLENPYFSLLSPEYAIQLFSIDLLQLLFLFTIILFPTGAYWGVDALLDALQRSGARKTGKKRSSRPTAEDKATRRQILKHAMIIPFWGIGGFLLSRLNLFPEKQKKNEPGSLIVTAAYLQKKIQPASLGSLKISSLCLLTDLFLGEANDRATEHLNPLIRSSYDSDRIFATLKLAQLTGMRTIIGFPSTLGPLQQFRRTEGRTLQYIALCPWDEALARAEQLIGQGAAACVMPADYLLAHGRYQLIRAFVDQVKQYGVPAGIAAHSTQAVKWCLNHRIQPDFWLKTCNTGNAELTRDNPVWCPDPEETLRYMRTLEQPWIASHVLAAGRLPIQGGFEFARRGNPGAMAVSAFDVQIPEYVQAYTNLKP